MNESTLAILGLGSRSTSFYFNELNRLYLEKNGGYSTCPFILLNSDFNEINSLLPSPSEPLKDIIQAYINKIEQFNSEHILIPNITLHETVDQLSINGKLIHPLHLTVSELKQKKCNQITLFGSLYSMQSNYIRSYFETNGFEVFLPETKEMELIDDARKQIYNGVETESVIKKYHSLIAKYAADNMVVLACTELSILKPKHNKNLIDMAKIQLTKAVSLLPSLTSPSSSNQVTKG
jgi:aspartate racemase